MTAPIYEPSEQRQIAALGYDKNQLQRRPAPQDPVGDGVPWARRAQYDTTDQSITSGSQINIELNTFFTFFPTYFSAFDNGSADGITVNVQGLYLLTWHLFWQDWPNAHQVSFIMPTASADTDYSFNQSDGGFNNTFASTGSMHQRLNAGDDVYMSVSHLFGSSRALEGFCGCYFEMVYLGFASTNYNNCDLNPSS